MGPDHADRRAPSFGARSHLVGQSNPEIRAGDELTLTATMATWEGDRIVEDAEPAQLFALRGTLTPVRSVGFRKDGKQLVAGAEDGTLTVWSLESPAAPNQATRTLEPLIVAEALDPKSASRPLAAAVARRRFSGGSQEAARRPTGA